jgi:hypothetical protein
MKGLRRSDRWSVAAGVCLIAGAILLVVAWYDISGTNQLYEQLPYLVSAGFTGLALVMVGCALLVAGRYDRVERRLARLVDAITEPAGSPPGEVADDRAAARTSAAPSAELVMVPAGTTFHRPTCPLVQGKPTARVDAEAIRDAGFAACPVCDPDDPAATGPEPA